MNTEATQPPRWYWIVSGLALVWMLFGLLSLIMDPMTSEEALAEMSEAQRELFEARPAWLFAVYALAILSGLGGTVALLLRKAWALPLFTVSLVAVVAQFVYVLFILDAIGRIGAAEALPFPLVIFTVGALLLWLSVHANRRGWIG
ncbi:hypothetical protein [Natronospira bacteriovora]|uniref:Sugar transporter n=1 Tax=Natronospira bacteriovora TaxID=3069753 RepID=A0ABU0W5M5_9GAMM|nr:hypothetical protein [Natronospira sp. AB-CW4]MDQ2069073.1 hypothetical protein [Natronospira sp. AB-CW4]